MPASRYFLLAAAVLACCAELRAQSPVIDHSEIKCLVVGKYRKMPAKFQPENVAQPRVYFRPEGVPSWYYVEMKPEAPLGHVGVLPKPTQQLVKKHVEYYVEAASRGFDSGRTPEYAPIVVAKAGDCDRDPLVPLYSKSPPSAVYPSLPQGFAMGGAAGIGTTAVVVGGGAAAAAAVILATGGDDPEQPVATTTPTTTPVVTVTTTTTLPPGGLSLSCQADIREGPVPLTVKFGAQASGGTGVYDFFWDFRDGGTSTQVTPSHTFTEPGTYDVIVRATSGGIVDTCTRTVRVLPAPPPAATFTLTTTTGGSGTGTITGPGITCPGDCTETYPPGTAVTITATAGPFSSFTGWTGDCAASTGPTCNLTMSANRTAGANFSVLSVTLPDATPARSTVVSRLEAPGARLAATLNGAPLVPPAPGQSAWTIEPRAGDNRLEAQVGDAAAGTWRVELAGVHGLERGSVHVLSGEVVSVGPDAVVFRLKGRAGERLGLAFAVR
jgi:hypothetical protein